MQLNCHQPRDQKWGYAAWPGRLRGSLVSNCQNWGYRRSNLGLNDCKAIDSLLRHPSSLKAYIINCGVLTASPQHVSINQTSVSLDCIVPKCLFSRIVVSDADLSFIKEPVGFGLGSAQCLQPFCFCLPSVSRDGGWVGGSIRCGGATSMHCHTHCPPHFSQHLLALPGPSASVVYLN